MVSLSVFLSCAYSLQFCLFTLDALTLLYFEARLLSMQYHKKWLIAPRSHFTFSVTHKAILQAGYTSELPLNPTGNLLYILTSDCKKTVIDLDLLTMPQIDELLTL